MPFFTPFRRAGLPEKALQAALLPALLLMGALVAAPFLLLVGNSFGDLTDYWTGRRMPLSLARYAGPNGVFVRFLHIRYNTYSGGLISWTYPEHWAGGVIPDVVTTVALPQGRADRQADDARRCLAGAVPWTHKEILDLSWYWAAGDERALLYSGASSADWRAHLRAQFGGIAAVNSALRTSYLNFEDAGIPEAVNLAGPQKYLLATASGRELRRWLSESISTEVVMIQLGDFNWAQHLRGQPAVKEDTAALRTLFGISVSRWEDVRCPETAPQHDGLRAVWGEWLTKTASPYMIRIRFPARLGAAFVKFLAARHGGEEAAARAWGLTIVPAEPPATLHGAEETETAWNDWIEFARGLPAPELAAETPEIVWRRWLEKEYVTLDRLNEAHGRAYAAFDSVPWPQPALDRSVFGRRPVAHALGGLFQNYRRAWMLMTRATPALVNTLVVTGGFTLLALCVNIGMGWCLSRFKVATLQLVLVYLLALAAFPVEAMAIPNFLVLRDLGLLNTLWAMILPAAVNGYFIYLVKTAFDAVPAAYFDEAKLLGAGEWRLFWSVGLPLVRPTVEVVGLYAFLLAYSNFLWALIAGQSRDLWTLPVLVFSMRNWWVPPPMLSAVLVLLTVPPLLVFLAAQRALRRGMSLPR